MIVSGVHMFSIEICLSTCSRSDFTAYFHGVPRLASNYESARLAGLSIPSPLIQGLERSTLKQWLITLREIGLA